MNINYHGKNITVTEDLKNLAEKKLSKLDKYFTEDISAKVIFEVNKKKSKDCGSYCFSSKRYY